MKRIMAVAVLALWGQIAMAQATPSLNMKAELGAMKSACLVGVVEGDGAEVTREELKDPMWVAVKAKMPRLKIVNQNCGTVIRLSFYIQKALVGEGRMTGYYGSIILSAERAAAIYATGEAAFPTVWMYSAVFSGSNRQSGQIREIVDVAVTNLAADYYKAGNE